MKKVFSIVLLLLCMTSISAQNQWEIHAGLSLPNGKFSDDNVSRIITSGDGGAGTGLNLGIRYINPIENTENLYLTGSMDFFYNGLSSDVKDRIIEESGDGYDILKYPNHINIPLLIGMEYRFPVSQSTLIYAEAGIGANYYTISKIESEFIESKSYEEYNYYYETTYNSSIKLAGKIGAGFLFNDKYSISLSYWLLGSHRLKYNQERTHAGETTTEESKFKRALDVNLLSLAVGIRF